MRTIERAALREEWVGRVADVRASGQSQRQWARDHGVTPWQLPYWLKRLSAADADASDTAWVTLAPARPSAPTIPGLTIRVGAAEIQVAPGCDPQLLQVVVRSLASC